MFYWGMHSIFICLIKCPIFWATLLYLTKLFNWLQYSEGEDESVGEEESGGEVSEPEEPQTGKSGSESFKIESILV